MNLTQQLEDICLASAGRKDSLFYKLLDVSCEMAKRIETLEERLDAKERARGYVHFPDQT